MAPAYINQIIAATEAIIPVAGANISVTPVPSGVGLTVAIPDVVVLGNSATTGSLFIGAPDSALNADGLANGVAANNCINRFASVNAGDASGDRFTNLAIINQEDFTDGSFGLRVVFIGSRISIRGRSRSCDGPERFQEGLSV
jgi:hypothetical protein